jgi:hypothetical protein
VEKNPGLQEMHPVASDTLLNLPATHAEQEEAPNRFWEDPGWQALQEVRFLTSEYRPT